MNTIPLDNVFNYIPKTLRDLVSDDDQIKSWALQAMQSLKYDHFQYVRDIAFYSVTNHKAVIDPDLKRFLKVYALRRDLITQSEVDALYNCCDTEYEQYPENGTFAQMCPLYHRLFLTSTFFKNTWEPVKRVQNLTDDYFCNIEFTGCNDVFSYDSSTNIMQTSFASGVIAVVGYYHAKDADNNFLIPEEPQVLWRYMAAYAIARYLEDQELMGKQNIATLSQRWQDRETKFKNNLRATWNFMSSDSKNIQSIMSTKFLRNHQVLLEYIGNVKIAN